MSHRNDHVSLFMPLLDIAVRLGHMFHRFFYFFQLKYIGGAVFCVCQLLS